MVYRDSTTEVLVVGAGPAGLAIAEQCARRGLEVGCIAPEPSQPWVPTYGCWEEEARDLDISEAEARRFTRPRVWVSESEQPRDLGGTYLRLDTARLQQLLTRRLHHSGGRLQQGRALAVEARASSSAVRLSNGGTRRTTLVIDASGAASPLVARASNRRPAFQAAYGELLEVDEHAYADGEMDLMDWRQPAGQQVPTFLYAMPLAANRVFVEETSLVGRPPLPLAVLRQRLHQRLARSNVRPGRVLLQENCLIPLGIGLPRLSQRTVAFGAAAGAVHPATGYQLARTLALAPAVAEAVAATINSGPREAARAAYEVIWPRWRRRAWELYCVGMEALAAFDLQETRRFIRAFFALPDARWRGFMQGTLRPMELAGAMWRVFANAPASLRLRLLSTSASRGSRSLMRAIAP